MWTCGVIWRDSRGRTGRTALGCLPRAIHPRNEHAAAEFCRLVSAHSHGAGRAGIECPRSPRKLPRQHCASHFAARDGLRQQLQQAHRADRKPDGREKHVSLPAAPKTSRIKKNGRPQHASATCWLTHQSRAHRTFDCVGNAQPLHIDKCCHGIASPADRNYAARASACCRTSADQLQ